MRKGKTQGKERKGKRGRREGRRKRGRKEERERKEGKEVGRNWVEELKGKGREGNEEKGKEGT